jgi:hypothetical protein
MSADKAVELEDMDELLRVEISKFLYAGEVIKKLNKAKDKLLEENASLEQVKNMSADLCQILQDSSRVSDVVKLINYYLEKGDTAFLLKQTGELAKTVNNEAANINKIQKGNVGILYADGIKEIETLPKTKIAIATKINAQKFIDIQSLVKLIWQQETSRISNDFRIIDKRTPYLVPLAYSDCQRRLQEFCHFLKDIFALRGDYKNTKIRFFGRAISKDKNEILNNIERKLAALVSEKKTINWREIYNELHPVLKDEAAKITKPGNLKNMLNGLISKYGDPALPNNKKFRKS